METFGKNVQIHGTTIQFLSKTPFFIESAILSVTELCFTRYLMRLQYENATQISRRVLICKYKKMRLTNFSFLSYNSV
jgi:hypothetical protein